MTNRAQRRSAGRLKAVPKQTEPAKPQPTTWLAADGTIVTQADIDRTGAVMADEVMKAAEAWNRGKFAGALLDAMVVRLAAVRERLPRVRE